MKEFGLELLRWWLRYSPFYFLKERIWEFVSWREIKYVKRLRFGSYITGNTRDIIQRYLYWFGVWEPHITSFIRRRLSMGDIFVDIGANIGYYSLLASEIVGPNGKVFSIEASPTIFRTLASHLELNSVGNVKAICIAVADRARRIVVHHAVGTNIGATSIVQHHQDAHSVDIEIDAAPLGDIVGVEVLLQARIIKIDVEGAEWLVLQGMKNSLGSLHKNCEIIFEIDPEKLTQLGGSAREILDLFEANGFHAYVVRNEYSHQDYIRNVQAERPKRLQATPNRLTDLIFSRLDLSEL